MGGAGLGVLFDIDDTLVDFAGAARSALLDVTASFGRDDRASEEIGRHVLRCWEAVSEREYSRFLAGELSFEDMKIARMAAVIAAMDPSGDLGLDPVALEWLRNESIFGHYRQYDDVAACVARFRAGGIRLGVVSNSGGDYQRRKMAVTGLHDLVDRAVFSGDLGVSKPDAEIFLAGAAMLGLAPERVVYVGDRWATDAVGALRAGLSAVWLNRLGSARPPTAEEELRSLDAAVDRLAELPDLNLLDVDLVSALVCT